MTQVQSGGGGDGRWPFRLWQFWCGVLAGAGVGLLLGAALVELELLTPHNKAWVSVLGIAIFGGGAVLAAVAGRGNAPNQRMPLTGPASRLSVVQRHPNRPGN
jgi:hypothetical protein